MNVEDLNLIASKIASEGIEVNDKDSLRDIYNLDDFNKLFSEFDCLIDKIEYKKQETTLIFYLGLFNLIDSSKIRLLCEMPEIKSFDLLKGGLIRYFIGNFDITMESYEISFHGNYLSRIDQWYDYRLRPMKPLFLLLRWIYFYDKELFFELLFMEKSNYIFLTFVHGGIVENIDFDEKDIQFDCTDEIKLYAIFYYFIKPFQYLPDSAEDLKNNLSMIFKIPLNFLMKIILDYIRCSHLSKGSVKFTDIIIENSELFFKTFESLEIQNFQYLQSFLFLLDCGSINFQSYLFELILNKLKILLMNKYIFIECPHLNLFYKSLNQQQIHKIIVLFEKVKENLIFTSELDSQIRNNYYYIDIKKYRQLEKLIQFSISYLNIDCF